jgi:ParB family chromosome partitioning protein
MENLKTKTTEGEIRNEVKSIIYLEIEHVKPNPAQPRRSFSIQALEDLCTSIKQYGVLQPVHVRKITNITYELIAGERRLRAAKMAGLKTIPAIIVKVGDEDSAVMALIENLQREDLDYMEEAEALNNLVRNFGFTQEELAARIGKSQSTIANKIRILKLPEEVKKKLSESTLSERHARALLKLHDEQLQYKVVNMIVEKGLNVRRTEELIEKAISKYAGGQAEASDKRRIMQSIKDVRLFVNTLRQAVVMMKQAGVQAKAAQFDRGEYYEFIVRVPKKSSQMIQRGNEIAASA